MFLDIAKQKPLFNHTSFETGIEIDGYPYGSLRTKIRYWIETNTRHGDRFVSCTLNPKTNRWNKPHAGTYSAVILMTELTEDKPETSQRKGFISHVHLDFNDTVEEFKTFLNFGQFNFNPEQQKKIHAIQRYMKIMEHVEFTVTSTPLNLI
jgi:hypothetical protein